MVVRGSFVVPMMRNTPCTFRMWFFHLFRVTATKMGRTIVLSTKAEMRKISIMYPMAMNNPYHVTNNTEVHR